MIGILQCRALSTQNNDGASTASASIPIPAGMSEYTFKRVTTDNHLKPEQLELVSSTRCFLSKKCFYLEKCVLFVEQIKLGIVKFIAQEIFPNEEILVHLIVAAADTRFSVANLADMELKKVAR